MEELAFYPAVDLVYFFGVLQASREDRIELNESASINVFLLFVFAQPTCLLIGGYAGMAAYLLTALASYNLLPWKKAQVSRRREQGPQKKGKEKKKNK